MSLFPPFDPEEGELEDIKDEDYWPGFREFIDDMLRRYGRYDAENIARYLTKETTYMGADVEPQSVDSMDPILGFGEAVPLTEDEVQSSPFE